MVTLFYKRTAVRQPVIQLTARSRDIRQNNPETVVRLLVLYDRPLSFSDSDECAGDFTLPVLAGVDVVAYFSLPPGAAPVFGSKNRVAFFGNYRFYFSSIENLRLFEVRLFRGYGWV